MTFIISHFISLQFHVQSKLRTQQRSLQQWFQI